MANDRGLSAGHGILGSSLTLPSIQGFIRLSATTTVSSETIANSFTLPPFSSSLLHLLSILRHQKEQDDANPGNMANHDNDCATTLFNNPQDSDIVLQLRNDKIYAHRVVLRLWSPFFNKALTSNFAVATNPVFELDDQDDNLEAIIAMVKHMYGMSYNEHAQNTVYPQKAGVWRHSPVLRSDLAIYTMADKYDCRAVRRAALDSFTATLHRIKEKPYLIHYYLPIIAYVCGSEAPRLADQSLYNATIEFFFNEHVDLKRWRGYREAIRRDDVFDAHCTRKLMDAELIEDMRLGLDDVD